MVRDMRLSRLNTGPHVMPGMPWVSETEATPIPFINVPVHLQGYVILYAALNDRKHYKRSDLLQEIFWATMKALPEWLDKAPKGANLYELRDNWEVVAFVTSDDQD